MRPPNQIPRDILAKTSGYADQLVKEAKERILHSNNIRRRERLKLYESMESQLQIIMALHYT
jgi:hypothetical protein